MADCQTANQKLWYSRFAEVMSEYENDYTWEPIEMRTEDNYILTSFIIKAVGVKMIKPPVVVHHGNGQDAAIWIKSLTPENPRFDEVIPPPKEEEE